MLHFACKIQDMNSFQKFIFTICSLEETFCSGLEKSPFGAKSDFEIWAFKVFCSLDQKKAPMKAWRWPHLKI